MFVGERTILNGNMYGFLEPLEATSLGIYQTICRQAWDGMFNIQPLHVCNDKIRRVMKQNENIILWHYQYGSKYDTAFWKYAKSLPFNPDDEFYEMVSDKDIKPHMSYSDGLGITLDYVSNFDSSNQKYGHWKKWNFDNWREGVE